MNASSLTVTPVLAIHGTGVPRFERAAAGVTLVTGKHLATHLRDRPAALDPELVQRLARLADRALREQLPWEDIAD